MWNMNTTILPKEPDQPTLRNPGYEVNSLLALMHYRCWVRRRAALQQGHFVGGSDPSL